MSQSSANSAHPDAAQRRCPQYFYGRIGFLVLMLAAICLSSSAAARSPNASIRERRHRQFVERRGSLLKDLEFELNQVASWCRDQGMEAQAVEVETLASALCSESSTTPSGMIAPPVDPKLPEAERQRQQRIRRIRQDGAKELYSLARDAMIKANLPTMAFLLIGDVVRIDPDHTNARRILGYQEFHDPLLKGQTGYAGEWVSPFEAKQRGGRIPHVLHPKFGWIPRRDVARYEAGERPWKRDWISKEKDALHRQDFRNAWEIRSEHFLVKTNVDFEEGVRVSRRLETFHDWLTSNFAEFFDTPAALKQRFQKAHTRSQRSSGNNPMQVHYFSTKDEYQRRVNRKIPPGIETNGLYWQPDRTSYFFFNPDRPGMDTVYHEGTHQILDIHTMRDRVIASRRLAKINPRSKQLVKKNRQSRPEWVLGGDSRFWVIEGLACYFESFVVHNNGTVSVGDPDHIRIRAARYRLLEYAQPQDHFFMPLEQFSSLGKDAFQQRPDRAMLYSQASGFAHFLMHYDNGRYRDDLVRLLISIYRPNPRKLDDRPNISDITGVSFAELEKQYMSHIGELVGQIRQKAAVVPAVRE